MNLYPSFNTDEPTPQAIFKRQMTQFEQSKDCLQRFQVNFALDAYWLPVDKPVQLLALFEFVRSEGSVSVHFAVTDAVQEVVADEGLSLEAVCARYQLPLFKLGASAKLKTVAIKKPWGQEIWYTGIEERGVAEVLGINGYAAPLPWMLSVAPDYLAADLTRKLILLKILDPVAEEVVGDLYFELHEEKREVYVVTAVDEEAWADGIGAIRFGFDQAKIAAYESDAAFKQAFVASVKAYEVIRRQIDHLRDSGLEISNDLLGREAELRQVMDGFTHSMPLKVGDVVKVPCLTPHSLQHGVRTVEFQTPVYERLILSFAQKVLTQSHWDTDKAAELMTLVPDKADPVELIADESALIERIVDFEDFEVRRFMLEPGQSVSIANEGIYALLMAVKGELSFPGGSLAPEEAAFLPLSIEDFDIENQGGQQLCFLLAYPKV